MSKLPKTSKNIPTKKEIDDAVKRLAIHKGKRPRYRVWGIAIDKLEPHDKDLIESVLIELSVRHGLIVLGNAETYSWPNFDVRETP